MKRYPALCLLLAAGAAQACGDEIAGAKRTVENSDYVIAYATSPAPQSVRVDAGMPAHKHGMNYRASVTRAGPGRYRAEGLLFHMSGRWELTFDVVAANRTERLASSIDLE